MKSVDFYTRKIAYVYLSLSELIVLIFVYLYSILYKKQKSSKIEKIAAYWHSPDKVAGSDIRMGKWKEFFEADGFIYDNFHINSMEEFVEKNENGNWTDRYLFFARCFWRRLPQMLIMHKYDVAWIHRGIIPFYPRKNAKLEKYLKRVVSKMVIDTTDGGDYTSNPLLMEDTLKKADEITVGYKYQIEMYSNRFKVTQIFWTIPIQRYLVKNNYEIGDVPIIGWMGSPGNFEFVLQLLPVLQKLAERRKFVFKYICRQNFDKELIGINVEHHYYDDSYYELISSFDISIAPYLVKNSRTMGKIAMKHLEFLICGVPQVCSDVAISEFVNHKEHVLISSDEESWLNNFELLLDDKILRESIGKEARNLYVNYYSYDSQYANLKKVLTDM